MLGMLIFGALGGLISLLVLIFWIWMLVDAIKNPYLDSTGRIVWVLVIIFLSGLGALIYYFAGRRG